MNEPEHLVSSQNRLGETPIWNPDENALYWVDWGGEPTCRFELATGKVHDLSGECAGNGFGSSGVWGMDRHRPKWTV